MTDEARIEPTKTRLQATEPGWFILNASQMSWRAAEGGGTWMAPRGESARAEKLGFGIHVLYPGDRPGYDHAEEEQEDFLVLSGECPPHGPAPSPWPLPGA